MRKLILMAIAGYLWKKFSARRDAAAPAAAVPMSRASEQPSY